MRAVSLNEDKDCLLQHREKDMVCCLDVTAIFAEKDDIRGLSDTIHRFTSIFSWQPATRAGHARSLDSP